MKGKKFLHLFFAAAMLLVVATAGFAATMDTFTLGLPGDAKSLDPQKAMDTMSFAVTKHINEPLVTVDGKTKKLVPCWLSVGKSLTITRTSFISKKA